MCLSEEQHFCGHELRGYLVVEERASSGELPELQGWSSNLGVGIIVSVVRGSQPMGPYPAASNSREHTPEQYRISFSR